MLGWSYLHEEVATTRLPLLAGRNQLLWLREWHGFVMITLEERMAGPAWFRDFQATPWFMWMRRKHRIHTRLGVHFENEPLPMATQAGRIRACLLLSYHLCWPGLSIREVPGQKFFEWRLQPGQGPMALRRLPTPIKYLEDIEP